MAKMRSRSAPAKWADALVDSIAIHKSNMLAFSITAAVVLGASALFFVFGEHEGGQLTSLAADVGGYVAVVGLVLGLPALGYAMVTDRAVEKLRSELGATKEDLEEVDREIHERLRNAGEELPAGHHMQIFVPNLQRTRLMPIYDPDHNGPEEGWDVNRNTPQAITGSAWVGDEYLCGIGPDDLGHPKLRLTAAQLERYKYLTGVAAAPMHYRGRKIGVLTIFTDIEHPAMKDEGFEERHRRLAELLAPVIRGYVPEEGRLRQDRDLRAVGSPSPMGSG